MYLNLEENKQKNLYYKEQLEKASKYKIDCLSLNVANEIECYFEAVEIYLSEEEFENVCSFVKDCYLKSEYSSVENCVKAMASIIEKEKEENENISIDEIINKTSKWDLLETASWYD